VILPLVKVVTLGYVAIDGSPFYWTVFGNLLRVFEPRLFLGDELYGSM
jgi:hypothetical protein